MKERSYIREIPEGVTLESLKNFYDSAPNQESAMGARHKTPPKCFYVNEIGIRAVTGKCSASLDFLLDECLFSPEKSVRYIAAGFLGDLSHSHPGVCKVFEEICKAKEREQHPIVKKMVARSVVRLRKQVKIAQKKKNRQDIAGVK